MNATLSDFLWAVAVIVLGVGMAVGGVLLVAYYSEQLAQQLTAW